MASNVRVDGPLAPRAGSPVDFAVFRRSACTPTHVEQGSASDRCEIALLARSLQKLPGARASQSFARQLEGLEGFCASSAKNLSSLMDRMK